MTTHTHITAVGFLFRHSTSCFSTWVASSINRREQNMEMNIMSCWRYHFHHHHSKLHVTLDYWIGIYCLSPYNHIIMIIYDPSQTNEPSLSSSFTNEDFLVHFSVQLTNTVFYQYCIICNANTILKSCLLFPTNELINLYTILAYSSIWRWGGILITPKLEVARF